MLRLLLLLTCITLGSMNHLSAPHLIVFTSEGAYYRLDPNSKHVEWHHSLGSSLLSFQMEDAGKESIPASYILPTLDGHFLYIDAKSEILIKREEVEQLLHVCLEGNYRDKTVQSSVEYFIYEKFEYYIINLKNGKAEDIETFLKNGIPTLMDNYIVLKIAKKYLKQLKKDLSVAWNTISSQLELFPAPLFLMNPKMPPIKDISLSSLKFRRVQSNGIEMVRGQQIFQISGKSQIFSIFELIDGAKGYLKHPLNFYQRQKLALEYIPSSERSETTDIIQPQKIKILDSDVGFIHSEQLSKRQKRHQTTYNVQQCVNIFRSLQAISDESKDNIKYTRIQSFRNNSLGYKSYESPLDPVIIYGPTQSQPYIWIALILAIIVVSFLVYRIKINTLLNEMSVMQSKTGEQLQQFKIKLGKMEQLKKMYEVYWDKVIYQVAGDQWYQHMVFEGKFLNQDVAVYAVRLEGTDIISLEHKLNTLLNFSHKGLCKLYYYTKNTQFLLIFAEKITALSQKPLPDALKNQMSSNAKKTVINEILQAVSYLDSKIQIPSLPFEALSLEPKNISQADGYYSFKLNSVPCLLKKPIDDSDDESRSCSADSSTYDLRLSLVAVFHLIIHQGEPLQKKALDEKLKNEAYSQDEYLQFFDFVIYQARSKADKDIDGALIGQSSRQTMFRDILDHPYLWDSKRKILFLSDFSNYIQTHIDESKVKKLEAHAKDYNVIKTPWIKEFHFTFMREVSNYRKYDYESVRDLIRLIRNKLNHFHEIPKQVKIQIGKTPEGFIEYCLELFPKLLHFAFVYTRKKKWKLHMK